MQNKLDCHFCCNTGGCLGGIPAQDLRSRIREVLQEGKEIYLIENMSY